MFKRGALVAGAVSALSAPTFAVFGISTGPGSSDTFFTGVGQVGGGGSGVLITPNHVLTAKHVGGLTFNAGSGTFTAAQRFNHPTSDLAILQFNENFPTFYPLTNATNPIGIEVTFVGFGDSGTLRTDSKGYNPVSAFGTRRSATNRIGLRQNVTLGGDTFMSVLADLDTHLGSTPAPHNRDWFGDGGPTGNEGGLRPGDSGGAWLHNVSGTWRLLGISSFIFADDAPSGWTGDIFLAFGFSGSGAVDLTHPQNRDWVLQTVPEPGTLAVFGLGLAALASLRRRKR